MSIDRLPPQFPVAQLQVNLPTIKKGPEAEFGAFFDLIMRKDDGSLHANDALAGLDLGTRKESCPPEGSG